MIRYILVTDNGAFKVFGMMQPGKLQKIYILKCSLTSFEFPFSEHFCKENNTIIVTVPKLALFISVLKAVFKTSFPTSALHFDFCSGIRGSPSHDRVIREEAGF